ncbi:40S ribosomal protein S5-1 [Hordeum vulgare]|nr:40S ribosomal protein S5-1 [Hordeum vulgare]
MEVGTSVCGGGGAISRGRCAARGQGRRSATPSSSPSPGLGRRLDGTALEFVVELHGIPRGHLHLPRPFARAMEVAKPLSCGCGRTAAPTALCKHVEYPKRRSMFLGRGWKAFARTHSLEDGHVLCFKLVEDNKLSVKFYGHSELGTFAGASDTQQAVVNTLPATFPPTRTRSSRRSSNPTSRECGNTLNLSRCSEGMLHIRDVEGPKKTGSVEARLEAMEQQVFKCQGMVERGLNANHMMITEFTNKHKIDANDIGKHLSRLYDRIDHLQAQIYDL